MRTARNLIESLLHGLVKTASALPGVIAATILAQTSFKPPNMVLILAGDYPDRVDHLSRLLPNWEMEMP